MTIDIIKKIIAVEQEAVDFGFEWPNNKEIIKQAISECLEIEEALENNHSKETIALEIGDLIHCAISLSVFNKIDPIEILNKLHDKFSKRINNLKMIAKQQNLNSFEGKSTEFMLELWKEAKKLD